MKHLLLIFAVYFLLTSCENYDCGRPSKTSVRSRSNLNPVVLSYFPYKANDTISYLLDGVPIIKAYTTYLSDTILRENYTMVMPDCGDYEVDEQQYRIQRFLNNSEFGMFELKLIPDTYNLKLNFNFGLPLNQSYEMDIDALKSVPDTFSHNNKLYIDVFSRIDSANRLEIYYSKSKGLLKIIEKNATIFMIL